MSEKIYALLLRLYPPRFREAYGDEAMQLVRERARDETGLFRRARMWVDLVFDLAVSVPQQRLCFEPALSGVPAQQFPARTPLFELLELRPPSVSALLYGGLLSLIAFGSLFVWIGQGRSYRLLRGAKDAKMFAAGSVKWSGQAAQVQTGGAGLPPPPAGALKVEDATDAMIEAFATHKIVLFGETHANKQEYEWLCKLVNTPEFADRVDDIVVEFGNSLYQKSVDRYIAGEDVPLEQVQKAWRNTVASVGPPSPVYERFYKAVRESNLNRPGRHHMRIVLGDPYGDWDKIKNAEDLGPYLAHRDEWYAQVVKDEVLARNHRALLIMGAGHFRRINGPGLIEREIRAAGANPWLVVFGTNAVGGYDNLDARFDSWPLPAIVPLAGNWVSELPALPVLTGGVVPASPLKLSDAADALFYAGPRDSLTQVNMPRSELAGTAYGDEIERRLTIEMGHPADFPDETEVAQYRRPPPQWNPSGPHGMMVAPPKSMNDPLPPRPPSQ
jgi:hypothetical protein